MPTVRQVTEMMSRPKQMISAMVWISPMGKIDRRWFGFRCALRFADDPLEVPEGLSLSCAWRVPIGPATDHWCFGLIFDSERVYAIDIDVAQLHKNKVGRGRPLFGQKIAGSHEHTWSDDGYGYVEPLASPDTDGPGAWALFAHAINLIDAVFVHPDDAVQAGQMRLPP